MSNSLNSWYYDNNLHIPAADRKRNRQIDVTQWVKKLQGLDYVPWSVAQDLLMEYNDKLDVGFEEDKDGSPFFLVPGRGAYLKPYLYDRMTGKRTPSMVFPVRNNKRQASDDVGMDTIGNQMQRAYAKCIAKETGLGWGLYSKFDESLQELEEKEPLNNVAPLPKPAATLQPKQNAFAKLGGKSFNNVEF